jgi:hypothetical protein
LFISSLLYIKECDEMLQDTTNFDAVIKRLKNDGDVAEELGEMKLLAKANDVTLDLLVSLWYTALFFCGGLGVNVKKKSVREDPAHRHVLVQLKMALLEMEAWREGEDDVQINILLEAATLESQTLFDKLTRTKKPVIT